MDKYYLLRSKTFTNVRISSCGFSSFAQQMKMMLYVCCWEGKIWENKCGWKTSSPRQKKNWILQDELWTLQCIVWMTATIDLVTGKFDNIHWPCHRKVWQHSLTLSQESSTCNTVPHLWYFYLKKTPTRTLKPYAVSVDCLGRLLVSNLI